MTSSTNNQQQQDYDCARFAREALFPKRLHREDDMTHHEGNKTFPALLVLDRYRQQLLRDDQQTMATFSNVFPRHVVVVRNLVNENDIQWNGQPDIEQHQQQRSSDAYFEVIPNRLSVRCTSKCDQLLENKLQKSFIVQTNISTKGNENERQQRKHEIVICTDRVLQSGYYKKTSSPLHSSSLATDDLSPSSLAAVEEVLAHALVVVEQQHQANNNKDNKGTIMSLSDAASIEVQAAQAAECYYYSRKDHVPKLIKRGSQLGFTGFSLLPRGIQTWLQRQCIQSVATEHLLLRVQEEENNNVNNNNNITTSRRDALKAIQKVMRQQQQQGGDCADSDC
jgi:hypothetical protein